VLSIGCSVGTAVGQGTARVLRSITDMNHFRAGEVLITEMTDPDWEPVIKQASAVVTNRGGRTCHAAIISRELGIPCIVGSGDATEVGITVSCPSQERGVISFFVSCLSPCCSLLSSLCSSPSLFTVFSCLFFSSFSYVWSFMFCFLSSLMCVLLPFALPPPPPSHSHSHSHTHTRTRTLSLYCLSCKHRKSRAAHRSQWTAPAVRKVVSTVAFTNSW
jgi:phosphohistidine swiveling domain-containing protein